MKFVFDNQKEMDRFIEKLSYLIFCPGDFDLPLGVPICDPDIHCLECWQNAFSHVNYEIVGEASPKTTQCESPAR